MILRTLNTGHARVSAPLVRRGGQGVTTPGTGEAPGEPAKKPAKRGGARPGAGRKTGSTIPGARVALSCRVRPETKAAIDALDEKHGGLGKALDWMASQRQ